MLPSLFNPEARSSDDALTAPPPAGRNGARGEHKALASSVLRRAISFGRRLQHAAGAAAPGHLRSTADRRCCHSILHVEEGRARSATAAAAAVSF